MLKKGGASTHPCLNPTLVVAALLLLRVDNCIFLLWVSNSFIAPFCSIPYLLFVQDVCTDRSSDCDIFWASLQTQGDLNCLQLIAAMKLHKPLQWNSCSIQHSPHAWLSPLRLAVHAILKNAVCSTTIMTLVLFIDVWQLATARTADTNEDRRRAAVLRLSPEIGANFSGLKLNGHGRTTCFLQHATCCPRYELCCWSCSCCTHVHVGKPC